jgi:hypothetical protein
MASTRPQQQARSLRMLVDEAPCVFREVARVLLHDVKDTQGFRYMIALLHARGLFVPLLRDLALEDAGAAGIATHLAMRLIPGLDKALARGNATASEMEAKPGAAAGILHAGLEHAVLEVLTGAFRMMDLVPPESWARDPKIRSRMALLLGRAATAWEAHAPLCEDADPRVRANAVESMWGQRTPATLERLRKASNDPHHRVRANALVGLYLADDPEGIQGMAGMAREQDPMARSAAAWAMGRVGDRRFEPVLSQLRRGPDRHPMVQRNALLALARLERAEAVSDLLPVRVQLLDLRLLHPGRAGLEVAVAGGVDNEPLQLSATHFQPSLNGAPIFDYSVQMIEPAAGLAIGFLLPLHPENQEADLSSWRDAFEGVAPCMRPEDLWAWGYYSSHIRQSQASRTGEILHLSAEETVAEPRHLLLPEVRDAGSRAELQNDAGTAGARLDMPEGPCFALSGLAEVLSGFNDPHVILAVPHLPAQLAHPRLLRQVVDRCANRSVKIHVAAQTGLPSATRSGLLELTERTGGWFLEAPSAAQLADHVRLLANALRRRWALSLAVEPDWTPGSPAPDLRIRSGRHIGSLTPSHETASAA